MGDEENSQIHSDRRKHDITYQNRREKELIEGRQAKAWGTIFIVLSPVIGLVGTHLTHDSGLGWLFLFLSLGGGLVAYVAGRIKIWSAGG